jgi:hypothetical protein
VAVFAGTVTLWDRGFAAAHGTVTGNPETPLGVTDSLHEVALPPTVAASVTFPPDDGSVVGDAVNDATVGAADA